MKSTSYLILVFFILLTMNACEESEYSFQPENQETSHSRDNKQKRLASMLATAQKDSSTRLFLKDEALKQVDGDYNFMFAEALRRLSS